MTRVRQMTAPELSTARINVLAPRLPDVRDDALPLQRPLKCLNPFCTRGLKSVTATPVAGYKIYMRVQIFQTLRQRLSLVRRIVDSPE